MANFRVIESEKDINPYGIQRSKAVEFLKQKLLIGLSEQDALASLKIIGLNARIIKKNGAVQPFTPEIQTNRVNLTILDDKVVEAAVY